MRALLLLLLLLPGLARAQSMATLAADEVSVTADGRLVATGNVQAFFEGTTLSARSVAYDRAADRLLIEGPILIRDPDGTILSAERAELDPRLENGILRGARIVLDRQLQLAAASVERTGGLSALSGVAATSCQVCAGRAPLWEIRARTIVHDEAAEQLYLEGATLRVRGLPVLWLPALRLPDPANERATGLLIPRVRTTDRLGLGLKLPVFVGLGDTRDLLLTPYLSRATSTLELRYREAFLRGDLLVRGAASRDDLLDGPRGFIAMDGAFDLGGVALSFAGRATSDDAYLRDYGWTDADRLRSSLTLTRAGDTSLLRADLSAFQSLRDDEVDGSLPPFLALVEWERRRALAGGTLRFGAALDGHLRTTAGTGDASRDALRLGAFADWTGSRVVGAGLLVKAEGRMALDAYRTADDPDADPSLARAAPAAAVTLRLPLVRRAGTVSDLLEPVASLGWQGASGGEPPNEDARLVELDAANLHALSRLPGEDRVEEGARLSFGLGWTREADGWTSSLAAGRLWRAQGAGLPEASGLAGELSDLLLAGRVDAGGFALGVRSLVAGPRDGWEFGKSEARLDWSSARVDLGAAYLFLPADAAEGRAETAAEWTLDAGWRPSDRWSLGLDARYDVARGEAARAGLTLGWRNECVDVDVSVGRRYTASDSVEPSTSLGLSVSLEGFAAGGARVAPGACRG